MVVDNKSVQRDPTQQEIKFILELFNSHKLIEVKKEIDKQLVQYPNSSILYNLFGLLLSFYIFYNFFSSYLNLF